MKLPVKQFKSLALALKELEPFVRNGKHLQTGKPFDKFEGLRSREILANWLMCVAVNSVAGADRLTFVGTKDAIGGDGVIYDTETEETWTTEHVVVPTLSKADDKTIQDAILEMVAKKQAKGGSQYASGKTLVVFLNRGDNSPWNANAVAKALPKVDFDAVWVVGLQGVVEAEYTYNVARLDLSKGNAPVWRVRINKDFTGWTVEPVQ